MVWEGLSEIKDMNDKIYTEAWKKVTSA